MQKRVWEGGRDRPSRDELRRLSGPKFIGFDVAHNHGAYEGGFRARIRRALRMHAQMPERQTLCVTEIACGGQEIGVGTP